MLIIYFDKYYHMFASIFWLLHTFFQGQYVYIGEPGEKPELSEIIDHLYHI
jgi:hypothetical protein